MKLTGEFTVKVNKYGKKTCEYIRAVKYERTMSEILITTICDELLKYDRSIYESHKVDEE